MNPLGIFLRTSIQSIWGIRLSSHPCHPWLQTLSTPGARTGITATTPDADWIAAKKRADCPDHPGAFTRASHFPQ